MKWKYGVLLLILWSCQTKQDKETIAEIGVSNNSLKHIQNPTISNLTFPLDFPVSELSKLINHALPEVLVDDTIHLKKVGEFIKITIAPTADMLLASYGNNLDSSIPMKVTVLLEKKVLGIKVNKSFDFEVRVDLNTKLAIGEDWGLISRCRIQKIHWIDPPVVEILGIKMNLKHKIEKKLNEKYDQIEHVVCGALQKLVPLSQQVEKIWMITNNTHRIGKKPIDIYLTSNPSVFSAHFSRNISDTLRVIVHVASEVYITPLEGLDYEQKPIPKNAQAKLHTEDKLDLKVAVNVLYSQLNEILNDRLDSTSFSYEGLTILLTNFSTGTDQNKLRIGFDVAGTMTASLEAYVYPFLDEDKNLLIDSIDYQVVSENGFLNVVDWLANDHLTDYLRINSKIPLGRILDSLDYKIVEALDKSKVGNKIDLTMNFTELNTDTLIFSSEGFQWFFDVKGNAHMFLTEKIINKSH